LENGKAGEVELSSEDLAEISRILEKYPRKGARFVDATDEQLLLWNWPSAKVDYRRVLYESSSNSKPLLL
jgi:hypothetical protein